MNIGQTVKPDSLQKVLQAMANNLTPQDNLYCKLLGPIVTAGTHDVEFTVQHNLGRVPTNYIWNVDQAAIVYDSRRANWTTSQLFLKCSVGSVNLYLLVM